LCHIQPFSAFEISHLPNMEAAGFLAVAQYRHVLLGQILYGGDDLSGETWDNRGWHSRGEIRENLFWLAAEACLGL